MPLNQTMHAPERRSPGSLALLALLCMLPLAGGCETWAEFSGDTASKAARQMQDKDFPDERRQGINSLVWRDFARNPPYTTRYREIATDEREDELVRATAVRALNQSRDASAGPIFVKLLHSASSQIRLEAVKALNRVPSADAVAPLLTVATDAEELKDTRIAAVEALQNYRTLDVARRLVQFLDDKDFGIVWQARQSLVKLTGGDKGYDAAEWLKFLTGPEKPIG